MSMTTRVLMHYYCVDGERGCPRLILADRLQEAGRDTEARLLRLTELQCEHFNWLLTPSPVDDTDREVILSDVELFVIAEALDLAYVKFSAARTMTFGADGQERWSMELRYVADLLREFHEAIQRCSHGIHFDRVSQLRNLAYVSLSRLHSLLPVSFDLFELRYF